MTSVRTSCFGLALALLCNVTGCGSDEPQDTSDERAQAAGVTPAACVDFDGNAHCGLGNAKLRVSATDGSLTVSNLSAAGKDGVSISLPQATSYIPTGTYVNSAAASTLIANAISNGVTTSTLKAVNGARGTTYAATFTGSGQAGTYSAIYSRKGQEVARVTGIPNGQGGTPPMAARNIWRWIKFHVRIVPSRRATADDVSGACSWEQSFDPNAPVSVTLASGQVIEVDNLELREDVAIGGSYPYLSFDRMEYTADGGTFTLNAEQIE